MHTINSGNCPRKAPSAGQKEKNSWCHADARQCSVNPSGKKKRSDNPGLKLSSNIYRKLAIWYFSVYVLRVCTKHNTAFLSLSHTHTHTHTSPFCMLRNCTQITSSLAGRPSLRWSLSAPSTQSHVARSMHPRILPTALRCQLPCLLTNAGNVICLPFHSHVVSYKLSRWYRYSETKGTRQPPQVHSSPLRPSSTEAMWNLAEICLSASPRQAVCQRRRL